jgi:hypothetical protein
LDSTELALLKLKEASDRYKYKREFYKGFNLNKVSDDLEGIYILYDCEDIPLYVGESGRMKGRLKAQISAWNPFDSEAVSRIEIIPFAKETTKEERMIAEKMFINLLDPLFNRGNTKRDIFMPKFELKRFGEKGIGHELDHLTLSEMKEL